MTVGVGDDQGAALLNKVDSGVIASFILGDVVLVDDLVVAQTMGSLCAFHAFDVSYVIAGVLVMYQDYADLYSAFRGNFFYYFFYRFFCSFLCGSFLSNRGSTCYQAESQNQGKNNSYEFLHVIYSSL